MEYEKIGPAPILNFTSQVAKKLKDYKAYFRATGGGGTPTTPIAVVGWDSVKIGQTSGSADVANSFRGLFIGSYAVIKLKDLTSWTKTTASGRDYFYSVLPTLKQATTRSLFLLCNKYDCAYHGEAFVSLPDKTIYNTDSGIPNTQRVCIIDSAYNDATALYNSFGDNDYLIYELATPTTPTITIEQFATLCQAFGITGNTFTINLGDTYYGGYVDWKIGKLVVTHEIVDLGTLDWVRKTDGAIPYFRHDFTDSALTQNNRNFICSNYPNVPFGNIYTNGQDKASSSYFGGIFIISDNDYSDAQTFKTAMSGVYLVYELAEPIETDITLPDITTIIGEQNIFADTGDMEAEYPTKAIYYKAAKVSITDNSNVQIQTASGSIANFNTSLALPLVALKTAITAQGGGGTPSAPVAITGVSAVNIVRTKRNLGSFKSYTDWEQFTNYAVLKNAIPKTLLRVTLFDKDSTIDMSGISIGFVISDYSDGILSTNQYRWFVQEGAELTNKTNTARGDTSIILTGLIIYPKTEETFNKVIARYNFEFEEEVATSYEPYSATEYTINLGQTVYGGYVDWENGKLVVTHAIIDLGTLTPLQRSSPNEHQFAFHILTPASSKLVACTSYICVQKALSNLGNYEITTSNTIGEYYPVILRNDDYNNATDLKESLDGVYLVYALNTPIEIDLPTTMPNTIEGVQNWFADSGDIELEYKKIIT